MVEAKALKSLGLNTVTVVDYPSPTAKSMTSMSPYMEATHVKSFPSIKFEVLIYPEHTLFTTSLTSMIDHCHIMGKNLIMWDRLSR